MKNARTISGGILAAFLLTGGLLFAQQGEGQHEPTPKWTEMVESLDLTEEQAEQLETRMEPLQKRLRENRAQTRTLQEETRSKIDAILTDEQKAELKTKFEERRQQERPKGDRPRGERGPRSRGQHGDQMNKAIQELDLTDDQRDEVDAILEEQKEMRTPLIEEQRELREEIHSTLEDVLTEDQMRELKESRRAERRGHGRPQRGR